VFIIVVDFVIDSVRKLLDTPSYYCTDEMVRNNYESSRIISH